MEKERNRLKILSNNIWNFTFKVGFSLLQESIYTKISLRLLGYLIKKDVLGLKFPLNTLQNIIKEFKSQRKPSWNKNSKIWKFAPMCGLVTNVGHIWCGTFSGYHTPHVSCRFSTKYSILLFLSNFLILTLPFCFLDPLLVWLLLAFIWAL